MTITDALQLRRTLQVLKRQDALSGHVKLAYAADKTLSELNGELEEYEEHRRRLLSEHSPTDEQGRRLMKAGDQAVAAQVDEEYRITALYEPGEDTELRREDLEGQLEHDLGDREAFQETLSDLESEEAGVDVHAVDEEVFFEEADLEGVHSQVDLSALDPWLKEA
jgi:hypothetical protein